VRDHPGGDIPTSNECRGCPGALPDRGATAGAGVRGESDYCSLLEYSVGDGLFRVGDAGCFIDPIFSPPAVYLAIVSGVKVAEAGVGDPGRRGRASDHQRDYENFVKTRL